MSVGDLGFFLIVGVALVLLAGEAVAHPSQFAQVLVFGLADGAIYALVALGYTMVYGIIELINFAHGDVFTLGAYVGATLMAFFAGASEDSFLIANVVALLITFPVVMLIMGAVNITIERVAYRPLRNAPRLAPLITAIGMSFLLEGIMFLWHGPATVHVPDLLPHGAGYQTTGGGGMIWGLYFNTITYNLGFRTGLVAFTSAVFGGIGNIPGTALGGMVIGLTAAFSDNYIGSKWTQVVIFGILIGVLVFRPTGLLGMRVPEK